MKETRLNSNSRDLKNHSQGSKKSLLKKITIYIMLMVFTVGIFSLGPNYTAYAAKDSNTKKLPPTPKVYSKSAIVINADNGAVLFNKNMDKKIYPASTGKVLTAILAIENGNLDDYVTITENSLEGMKNGGAHIALNPGEKITLNDAIHGLLLASANECAISIAEHISGSEEDFAKLMNKKAKELGLSGSHFTNASGLYNKEHYSTAEDLAKITAYAIKNPDFVRIFSTLTYKIPPTNLDKEPTLINNAHRMVKHKSYEYDGVIGGKRGYITESRFNLITYARRDDMGLITVVTKGDSERENLEDTTNLFNYFYKNYKSVELEPMINGVDVNEALKEESGVLKLSKVDDSKLKAIVAKKADLSQIKGEILKCEDLDYPIAAGQQVGEIKYSLDGNEIATVPLLAKKKIRTSFGGIIKIIAVVVGVIILIGFLLLVILLLIRRHNIKKRKARRAKNKKRIQSRNDSLR